MAVYPFIITSNLDSAQTCDEIELVWQVLPTPFSFANLSQILTRCHAQNRTDLKGKF